MLLSSALRQQANPTLFPPIARSISIEVVDHGYHSGLIIPRAELLRIAMKQGHSKLHAALTVFHQYESIEFGWGEKEFYQNVRVADFSAVTHVMRAMFNPFNESVLHLVGFDGKANSAFLNSSVIALPLSEDGLSLLAQFIDESFQSETPIGPGLYGPSAFFMATGRYSLFNTCNHWIGKALAKAGVPYAPVESFISGGLMFDLKRRALPANNVP